MSLPLAISRKRTISRLQGGESQFEGANVAMSTMCGFWGRFQATGNTHSAQGSGRSRMTSSRQYRVIPSNYQRDSFRYKTDMARTMIDSNWRAIPGQTARLRLRGDVLLCRRPSKRPILTSRHRHQLLAWAQHHRKWTWHRWRNVTGTDESILCR